MLFVTRSYVMTLKTIEPSESCFKTYIDSNFYYVDKTLMIKDLLGTNNQLDDRKLILRPRRFGKTLMQSTLQYFFDIDKKEESKNLFTGLNISKYPKTIEQHQNKYPVIFITFNLTGNNLKYFSGDDYLVSIRSQLSQEYKRHSYLEYSIEDIDELEAFKRIKYSNGNIDDYHNDLSLLTKCLYNYHSVKPIILIYEYDVPLNAAYEQNCYEPIKNLISMMFSKVLKDNEQVETAIITGCLKIAKNQIFTGLNNLTGYTVLDKGFNNHFVLLKLK